MHDDDDRQEGRELDGMHVLLLFSDASGMMTVAACKKGIFRN
jgi:hypothetical protein